MLTDPQIWKLKAAQRQAGIDDAEYRETLQRWCGVATSKDPRIGNEHWDMLLAYFETIYWRGVDAGLLQPPCKPSQPFQQRGYWAAKNTRAETSRDRYNAATINEEIASLEHQLASEFGCGQGYFHVIKSKVIPEARQNMTWPAGLVKYRAALDRTLAAKRKKANAPF